MPKKEIQILEGVELYLETVPPRNCGQPDCLTCMAQQLKADYLQDKINSKGNHQMQSKNQQISEKFVHGPEYLAEWNRDVKLRQEFDGDFEAYCYYKSAYSNGHVKMFGGRR